MHPNRYSWTTHQIEDKLDLELLSFDIRRTEDLCSLESEFGNAGFRVFSADTVNLKVFIFMYVKHEVYANDAEGFQKPVFPSANIFKLCKVSIANVYCTRTGPYKRLSNIEIGGLMDLEKDEKERTHIRWAITNALDGKNVFR